MVNYEDFFEGYENIQELITFSMQPINISTPEISKHEKEKKYLKDSFKLLLGCIDDLITLLNKMMFYLNSSSGEDPLQKESIMKFVKSKQMFYYSPHIFLIDVCVKLIQHFKTSLHPKEKSFVNNKPMNKYELTSKKFDNFNLPNKNEIGKKLNNTSNNNSNSSLKYFKDLIPFFGILIDSLKLIFMEVNKFNDSIFIFYKNQYLINNREVQKCIKNKNNKKEMLISAYLAKKPTNSDKNIYLLFYNGGAILQEHYLLKEGCKETIFLLMRRFNSQLDFVDFYYYNKETSIILDKIPKNKKLSVQKTNEDKSSSFLPKWATGLTSGFPNILSRFRSGSS